MLSGKTILAVLFCNLTRTQRHDSESYMGYLQCLYALNKYVTPIFKALIKSRIIFFSLAHIQSLQSNSRTFSVRTLRKLTGALDYIRLSTLMA